MSTSTLGATSPVTDRPSGRRLAVAWQHPGTRRITPVGLLTCGASSYTFSYLMSAARVEGFQPFLSFPDLSHRYEAASLFSLFAQRVMRASRPDFIRYRDALGLGAEADDWSILARSQGQREGDGIRVFSEPSVDASGRTSSTFFVSGLRHRMRQDPRVVPALDGLTVGDRLSVVDEPDNQEDARALLVAERTGVALAWIPTVLLAHVHAVRAHGVPELDVAGINGADVPPAHRLLVTLRGTVPAGYRPFTGSDWTLASDIAAVPA